MSKQGWLDFLHAEGVDDWVVLHGGATAVFRVSSLGEAADLAQAISQVPGIDKPETVLAVHPDRLTVRLTRRVFQLEQMHVELALAVSAIARSKGATSDRGATQEVQIAISAKPDEIDVDFWRAVLGYDPGMADNALDPLGHGSTIWMQDLNPDKSLRHAMHIDVSVAREFAEQRLSAALAAGGRIVDDSEAPEGWILADPAGNKVCIASWPDGATPRNTDKS
jgi:4a-hydroxytetrahydrobiopterin dehydratase